MNKEIIEYDDRDNLIHYKGNYNNEAWSTYDENNNLIHCRHSNGYESWSKYDDYNREVYFRSNDGTEEWFKYNKNNERIDMTKQEFKQIERTIMYLNNKKINRFEIMDI